jgi:DNA-binding NarL/FixJ family response regulator
MMSAMGIPPASVLIIEKHPLMRVALSNAIAAEPDLQVAEVDINTAQTLAIPGMEDVLLLPASLDIIVLSLGNPGLMELEALKALHLSHPEVPILVLISNEVLGQEQDAMEAGAQVVLTKGASRSEIIRVLSEMRRKKSMDNQNILEQEASKNTSP